MTSDENQRSGLRRSLRWSWWWRAQRENIHAA
jgi:hypothetical protein